MPGTDSLRRLGASARADVERLVAAAEAADGFPALSDHARITLASGDGGLAALWPDADGLAGYAQASPVAGGWTIEVVVHPAHRDDYGAIAGDLVSGLLGSVAASGGGRCTWWVFHGDPRAAAVAARSGLAPSRELLQMRRALPAPFSTDVAVRPFAVGRDEAAWVEVNNAAFAWHPEQGGWTVADLRAREAEPWFDPAGFLVHERDGRMAAFCWTKLHGTTPPMGEIYVIAVHPDFHGAGLGRALTVAGLRHIAEQGIAVGMLHVDAGNRSAVALYERLGFEVHHTDRAFSADIAKGAP